MIDFDQGFVDEGVVDKIASRDTKSGTFYNIQVDGEWFGYGKYPPKFGEGSVINFDIQYNGDFMNVNTKTLEVIEEVAPQRGRGGGNSGRGGQGAASRSGGNRGGQSSRGSGNASQRGGSQGGSSGRGSGRGASSGNSAASGGMSKDDYWKRREERDLETQKRIQFQASRNAAISTVGLLLSNSAVSLPTKKAEQYDAVLALIDTITERYENATNGTVDSPQGYDNPDTDDGVPFDDDLPE